MANTVITLKKSATPSQVPGDLANGELAINYADGKLFYKDSSGNIQEISSGGNTFSTVNAAGTFIVSDLPNDILTIDQGNNIIITGDSINDKITIAADLTAANAWANTKLSNGTVTLNGALTTTGQIYANQQITVYPLGSGEGGEIQLLGSDSYPDWSIDSYQNSLRFFTLNAGSQIVSFFNGGTGNVKVGINTSNPGYEIDVVGDVNVTGAFRVNGTPITTGGGSMDYPYANSVGIAGNTYTNAVGIAANTWANTKLANTSGVMFEGTLNIKNNLWIGNNITNVSSIIFNTSTNRTPTTPGELTWSQDDSTLHFDMDTTTNVIGHIGQDVFYYVKNQTGSSIAKGTVVRFAGTLGASGRLLIAPAIANNSYPSKYVMGVTATSIANGDDGFVLSQGKLRQIDTSMFSEGDILYLSPTTAGAFSNTMPTAPNNKITVAAVVKKDNTVGAIEVRVTLGSKLNEDELVELDTLTGGDVLVYNGTTGRFENKVQLSLNAGSVNGLSANTIIEAANGYSRVFANSVGTAGNANLSVATVAANAYATSVGTSGNAYTDTVVVANLAIANAYARVFANSVGDAANANLSVATISANNFAGSMANSSNAYASATYYAKSGGTISGDVVITGNLTTSGVTTFANTQTLLIGDNLFVLNADLPVAVAPSEDAGMEVNRGSSSNVSLIWSEGLDKWSFTNDGTTYVTIASNTDITNIGSSSNAHADAVGAAGNANLSVATVAANAYAASVGVAANAYTDIVVIANVEIANAYSRVFANSVGSAGNAYTDTVVTSNLAAAKSYSDTVVIANVEIANAYSRVFANSVGDSVNANLSIATVASNSYATSVGLSSNNFAGVMANSANAYAASLTPDLTAANNWANTKVASVSGTSGQIFSSGGTTPTLNLISTGVTATTYGGSTQIPVISVDEYGRLTSASNVAVSGMDYPFVNTATESANNFAGVMANSANAYAASLTPDLSPAFNQANAAYDKANSANVIAVAAYDKANNALANTTNTVFSGNLITSGVVRSTGLQDSTGRLLIIKDSAGTVVWGN